MTKTNDFWQLGILLYELIYSHTPFAAGNDEETLDYVLNCQVVFPKNPIISSTL
jgi:serine/threonine protein kinase